MVSSMMLGSASVAAETTWIIEKLTSALPGIDTGIPDAPDYGMGTTITDVGTRISSMVINVQTLVTDLAATALQGYVDSMTNFNASNADPLLTVIDEHAEAMLDDVSGIVGDIGTIGHAVWEDPQQIIDWLDSPINIPFLSGFYEGLVDHELTMLDFIALVAAIPYSIIGPNDWQDDAEEGDRLEGLFYTVFSLMLARSLAIGISCGLQIPADDEPENKKIAKMIEISDIAVLPPIFLSASSPLLMQPRIAKYGWPWASPIWADPLARLSSPGPMQGRGRM